MFFFGIREGDSEDEDRGSNEVEDTNLECNDDEENVIELSDSDFEMEIYDQVVVKNECDFSGEDSSR